MPITTYEGFIRMTSMCKTHVPQSILDPIEKIKMDDSKVREFGIELCVRICSEVIKSGVADGIHLYTMNNEDNIREIVRRLSSVLPPVHSKWLNKTLS